jgi:ATP-dependent Clp protease protease subunit
MNRPPLVLFNYAISNKDDDTIDIHVDGEIVDAPTQQFMQDWWGDETSVSYRSFRNQIEKANPKTINLRVNSPGGHVGDAMAMHDYLEELEAKGVKVNRTGTGIVASAGTYLVMGKNSQLTDNCLFMIHNIQMVAYGDINQIENQARAGRKFNDLVTNFYVNQTGKPKETISAWMNKETWFTAQEAKDNGFVQNKTGSAPVSNSIKKEQWPFSNMAMLNTYNSFTHSKSSNMKIENIKSAVLNALMESGIIKNSIKNDDVTLGKIANAIATAIEKEVSAGLEEKVKNAVTAAVKNGGTGNIEEVVKNTLQAELARTGEGSIAEAINAAVIAVVKNSVEKNETITKVQNELRELTENVTKKLGNKAAEKEENQGEGERKVSNKKNFYHVGEFVKN